MMPSMRVLVFRPLLFSLITCCLLSLFPALFSTAEGLTNKGNRSDDGAVSSQSAVSGEADRPAVGTAVVLPGSRFLQEGPRTEVQEELARKVAAVVNRPRFRQGFWGVEVVCLDEGRVLYSLNGDKLFSPASNVKVFTTAAALDRLGPNFSFQTHVGYEGTVSRDGVLQGDLVLRGEGDPDLANHLGFVEGTYLHVDRMVEEVVKAGIRVVEGDVVGDDTFFVHAPHGRGWTSSDVNRSYGAPISSLSFNDNLVTLIARPGRGVGQPNRISVSPSTSMLRIVNRTSTTASGSRSDANWHRPPGTNTIHVSGGLPANSRGWSRTLPVGSPALFTAGIFHDRLRQGGVEVRGTTRARHSEDPPPGVPTSWIYTHHSLPLIDIVAQINKRSHNLYAEMLLRSLGAELLGEGTDVAGLQVVYDFLRDSGIDPSTVDLYDGSGLSRSNLITPRAQTLLLAQTAGRSYFPQFLESLAVAGEDGTLRRRMSGIRSNGRVYAKTGSLNNVTTLGGYVLTQSGGTLAFAILINNYSFGPAAARQAIDEICRIMAEY